MAVTQADGVVVAVEQQPSTKSHIDWGAVIAGAVMAAAVSFVLLTFGSALGLSFMSPEEGSDPPGMLFIILTALWTVVVTVASFSIGGYLAGRMRRRAFDSSPHEVTVRDATHGLTVWAVGVLIGGILAASAAAGVVKTGVQVATAAVGAGATAVGAAASDEKASAYFADTLFRASALSPAQSAVGAGPAPDDQAMLDDQAMPDDLAMQEPMGNPGPISDEAKQEAGRILVMGATRDDGMTEADKAQLAHLVAQETGISDQEARTRVDNVLQQVDQAATTAEAKAREAADAARKVAVLAAFLTVASLLVAAAGASMAARMGGRHRDEGIGLAGFFA